MNYSVECSHGIAVGGGGGNIDNATNLVGVWCDKTLGMPLKTTGEAS